MTTSDAAGAKVEFANAQKLFKAGKFADALPLFRNVADATRSPNAWLYVGHCLTQLGRHAEAHRVFTLVVKEITEHPESKYEPTREAAVAELAVLNVRVGKVVISVTEIPAGVEVKLDGTHLEEKDLGSSIVVQPGEHHIEALATAVAPIRRDVTVEAGEMKTVTLSFRKLEEEPAGQASAPRPAARSDDGRTMRMVGYVAGGVGVAGMLLFVTTGLMAKSKYDRLEEECPGGCSDPSHLGDIDVGKSLQTTANIGLVLGVLGIGGGAALVILGKSKGNDGPSVSLGSGGGTVSYAGHF